MIAALALIAIVLALTAVAVYSGRESKWRAGEEPGDDEVTRDPEYTPSKIKGQGGGPFG